MAEWTGYLYEFYTNKPIDFVFSEWKKKVSAINYKYEYTAYQNDKYYKNDKFLFCYKNKEMYEYHLEYGYNIDMQGEGCFMIQAHKTPFKAKATLFEIENGSRFSFEPYDIDLRFNSLFAYVLVLPEEPENSSFSQKIRNLFISVLDEVNDSIE